MLNHISIGLSGLTAANRSILVVGENITKSNIQHYHRKVPILSSLQQYGVIYKYTIRETDNILQNQYNYKLSDISYYDELHKYNSLYETYLTNENIIDKFNNTYNILTQINSNRYKLIDFISSLNELSSSMRNISNSLKIVKNNIINQIETFIQQINSNLTMLSRYNNYNNIKNDKSNIQDSKDELITNLLNIIDAQIIHMDNTVNILSSNGVPLLLNANIYNLTLRHTASNIIIENDIGNIGIKSGQLGALLYMYNEYLPEIQARLNNIVSNFIRNLNHIQATGIGAAKEYDSTISRIPVIDVYTPLAAQNLPYQVYEGDITISITDTNLSLRNNYTIHIDPNVHSLDYISNQLSSLSGITSSVDSSTGLLTINALPGYLFDFAGRDTIPPTSAYILNPDTSGLLSALGINSILDGYNADTIFLQKRFLDNPNLFASSKTGEPGNNDNILRLLETRENSLFTHRNLIQDLTQLITNIGSYQSTIKNNLDTITEMFNDIKNKLYENVGVDTNEEFVNLLLYQKMFEASSKYIIIVNQLFDSLLDILR